MSEDSRDRLVAATVAVLSEDGMTGATAESIGARAGVAPALVDDLFVSLEGLLIAAARHVATHRVVAHRDRLTDVASLSELAAAARELHLEEQASGSLTMLAELLAAARTRPWLVDVLADNFRLHTDVVAEVLDRVLVGSPVDGLIDTAPIARTVAAGFVGIELLDAVTTGHDDLFATLDDLAELVDVLLEAGPLSRAVIRRVLRSRRAGAASSPRTRRR